MRVDSLQAATVARLATVELDATLQAAASCLARQGIGLVVVCSNTGAAGVLTKSDLVRHLATAGASDTPAALLMSKPIVSCKANDDVYDVWQTMTERKLQNVPVLGDGLEPLGILDIRDAMQALLKQEQYQEHQLIDYIAGIGYR